MSDQCGADTKVCVNVSLKVNYRFQYMWRVNCNLVKLQLWAPTDIIGNWNHLSRKSLCIVDGWIIALSIDPRGAGMLVLALQ